MFTLNLLPADVNENPPLYKSFGISEERMSEVAKKISDFFKEQNDQDEISVGRIIQQTAGECENIEELVYFSTAIGGYVQKQKQANPLAALAALLS